MGCTSSSAAANNVAEQPSSTKESVVQEKFEEVFRLGEKIGEGGFAVVRIAFSHKIADQKVAVKIAKREKLKDQDESTIRREFQIMKSLNHPNIVQALGLYEENQHFYFVLEYMEGGELFDRIVEKKQYNEREARNAIRSVIKAMEYCHRHDIVHRDLKPENLLLTSTRDDADVKIADFGLARVVEGNSLTDRVGTSQYLAPEVIEGKSCGKPVDMWAVGVILFVLLGGYSPFKNKDPQVMFRDILKSNFKFHPQRWSNVSEEAKSLIRALLTVSTEKRLTASEALKHQWITLNDKLLMEHDLTDNLEELRSFNATRKFKVTVQAVQAINKFLKARSGNIVRDGGSVRLTTGTPDSQKSARIEEDVEAESAPTEEGVNIESAPTEKVVEAESQKSSSTEEVAAAPSENKESPAVENSSVEEQVPSDLEQVELNIVDDIVN